MSVITEMLPSMEDIQQSANDIRDFWENLDMENITDDSLAPCLKLLDVMDKEIKDADRAMDETENAIEEMEDSTAKDDVLKLFADPANWNGTTFSPVMRYIENADRPDMIADKVLR